MPQPVNSPLIRRSAVACPSLWKRKSSCNWMVPLSMPVISATWVTMRLPQEKRVCWMMMSTAEAINLEDEFKGGQGPARKGEKYSLKRTAGTRLLYTLKQRVRVQAQLQFVPIAKGAVEAGWATHMQQAFDEAMRSAR